MVSSSKHLDSEDIMLTVKNTETNEVNEAACKIIYIKDNYIRLLIKKLIEVSPVFIADNNGNPPLFMNE